MARPLPDLVLFLDECLGSTDVSGALRAAGIRIELFHEHFDASTPDDKWLAEVGHRGWTALTKDQRIRRRQAEFEALLEANVAAFVLTSGNLTGPAMGRAFVLGYTRMQKCCATTCRHSSPRLMPMGECGCSPMQRGARPRRSPDVGAAVTLAGCGRPPLHSLPGARGVPSPSGLNVRAAISRRGPDARPRRAVLRRSRAPRAVR